MDNNLYPYEYEYEDSISLKDMLAAILDKWVVVLVFLIIGALVGLGIYALKSGAPTKIEVTQESVDLAREPLNIEQIDQVDYLYAQYKSYKEYRKLMQAYMADSLYTKSENVVILNTMFYVESDIHNVNSCFTTLAVGKNEMEQIAGILGKDTMQLDDVYRRVTIANTYSDLLNGTGLNYEMSHDTEEVANKNILQASVVAESEEQAQQMMAVIKDAFQREADTLKSMDPDLQFSQIGEQYSNNLTGYMQAQQTAVINNLNDANNQILNLDEKYISKLDSDEKAYFDAMKEYDDQEIIIIKKPSIKKLTVIGAVVGLVIGVVLIILWYIFNRRVKTVDAVASRTRTDIPYVLYKKKPGFHLFGGWSRRLKGTDLSDVAISQELVTNDILIKLSQMDCKSAYLVTENHTLWAQEIAKKLQESLNNHDPSVQLHSGNPLTDVEELKAFADAEAVIMLIQLKDTKTAVMEKWISLSTRYQRQTAGAVVLEEC